MDLPIRSSMLLPLLMRSATTDKGKGTIASRAAASSVAVAVFLT